MVGSKSKRKKLLDRYRKNAKIIPWNSTVGKWELSDILVRRIYLENTQKKARNGG